MRDPIQTSQNGVKRDVKNGKDVIYLCLFKVQGVVNICKPNCICKFMQATFGSTTLRNFSWLVYPALFLMSFLFHFLFLATCFKLSIATRSFAMSIGSAILSLEALARKAEYTAEAFDSLNSNATFTKQQYHALDSASMRIWEVVAKVADKIDHLKEDYVKWTEKEGKALTAQAVSAREYLITHGRPKGPATFRRNITLFFDGPKDSPIDSSSVKSRNKLTSTRCEWIRCLSPHGIISWAAAFPPTVWTGGFMPFDYLIENVEPEEFQAWPMKVEEILRAFAAEEPLRQSNSYNAFLGGQVGST